VVPSPVRIKLTRFVAISRAVGQVWTLGPPTQRRYLVLSCNVDCSVVSFDIQYMKDSYTSPEFYAGRRSNTESPYGMHRHESTYSYPWWSCRCDNKTAVPMCMYSRSISFFSLCLHQRPVGDSGQPIRVYIQFKQTEASWINARRSTRWDLSLTYSIKNVRISTASNISSGRSLSLYRKKTSQHPFDFSVDTFFVI